MGWSTVKVHTQPNGEVDSLEKNYVCKGVEEYYHLRNGRLNFLSDNYVDAVERFEAIIN